MKNHSISDIESIMRDKDEQQFQEHYEKIEIAYLELVKRKLIFSSQSILCVNEVNLK
jgi:hypothetical protein